MAYRSTDEGAPPPLEGLLFDVHGGGPLLEVTAASASISVTELRR